MEGEKEMHRNDDATVMIRCQLKPRQGHACHRHGVDQGYSTFICIETTHLRSCSLAPFLPLRVTCHAGDHAVDVHCFFLISLLSDLSLSLPGL
jgi:hypothetical protein